MRAVDRYEQLDVVGAAVGCRDAGHLQLPAIFVSERTADSRDFIEVEPHRALSFPELERFS